MTLEYEDDGTQTISFDFGFFEASPTYTDQALIYIYGVTEEEDLVLLKTETESSAYLPSWGTYTYDIHDFIPEGDEAVALLFVADGAVGIDNVGIQRIELPGWHWASGTNPGLQEEGPQGNYLRLYGDGNAWVQAELPNDVKSLAYWYRISSGGTGSISVGVGDGDEYGEELVVESIEVGTGTWIRRMVDLAQCPPLYRLEDFDCETIDIALWSSTGTVDFAFSTSSDSDEDEDGIYDDWEEYGVLVESPGEMDVNFMDLPAMGADPEKPDIFVHLDYMYGEGCPESDPECEVEEYVLHDASLYSTAIGLIVEAFANSPYISPTTSVGINLHVDQGPDSILDFEADPQTTWGELSQATTVPYDRILGSYHWLWDTYEWDEFDDLKEASFIPKGRSKIFHYAIAAHRISKSSDSPSGKSRGIEASDFIIGLGGFIPEYGTYEDQAGVLMHELGHNLGLRHGGDSNENRKPNYLSVMNYSFTFVGVIKDNFFGTFDYSRQVLDMLDEEDLEESVGLGSEAAGYGTSYYCGSTRKDVYDATDPIDWNCDLDATDTDLTANVNMNEGAIELTGYNDWEVLDFWGGSIGDDGPSQGEKDEPHELTFEELLSGGLLKTEGRPGIEEFLARRPDLRPTSSMSR